MAELGQTDDPKELVPGEPEAVTGAADGLRSRARTMEDVAGDLAAIRIPDWQGPASSAFWDKFTPEASNWRLGRDAMNSAAGALDSHASSLTWAQGQAAEAIALWEQGEQATRRAMESGSLVLAPSGTAGGMPLGSPTLLNDPGAALRQRAVEVLDRAREQLSKAGDTAAGAIEKVAGKADGAPGWLTGPAQFVDEKGPQKVAVDIKQTESWAEKAERKQGEGSRFARYGQWGDEFAKRQGPGVNVHLVGGTVQGSLFSTNASGATQIGDVTLAGKAEASALGAEASATAGIGRDGVNAQARASAYLAQVSAQGSAQYGIAEVGAQGKAFVGAEAGAHGSIGLDGARVGGEAFAGAKATGEVSGDVGGLGAGVTGEAWAGVGASADAQIGRGEDGEWKIGAEAGIGLGIGGKVGFEVSVDPGEITDTLGDAASAVNPFD
ncbi:putative T7SS-secreted protein [Actinophytocola sp.]|uniref:putative T7SS-secreted protein n=1 Tax=Actinophytocola sp. TaxID=1872138 RepID=UPI003D6A02EA